MVDLAAMGDALPHLFLCDKDRDALLAAGLLVPREDREVRVLPEQRLLEEVWPENLGPYKQITLVGFPPEASIGMIADRCKEAEKVLWISTASRGFTPPVVRACRAAAPNLRVQVVEEKTPLPLSAAALKITERFRKGTGGHADAVAEVASGKPTLRTAVLDGLGKAPQRVPPADLPHLLHRLSVGRYKPETEPEDEFRATPPVPAPEEAAIECAKKAQKIASAVYLPDAAALGAARRATVLHLVLHASGAPMAFLLHRPGWLFGAIAPGNPSGPNLFKFFQDAEVDGVRFGGEPKGHPGMVSMPGIRADSGADHAAACRKVVEALARL